MHDIHTHWYKHPHQSRLQVRRKCDSLSAHQNQCCVCLRGIWLCLSISRSPFSASLPFALLCVFIGGDLELKGSLMRLFDRAVCSVKPRYMCALHVLGRALPYWYTFYAKYGACGDGGGWRDWRMQHVENRRGSPWLLVLWQAALQMDGKHRAMPNIVQESTAAQKEI